MKRVVIAGAGGFGRGVYGWLVDSVRHREAQDVREIVFVDDFTSRVASSAAVLGTVRDYVPLPNDEVICAVGDPVTRRAIVEHLRARRARFHTFVDDRAVIGSRVTIGDGVVVCPGVVVSADVRIGAQVHINFNSSIGHDTVIGDFVTLSPSVNVMGQVEIGALTFLGGSAVILPRLELATGVTVGAGAVVVRDVADGVTVAGNPARPIAKGAS